MSRRIHGCNRRKARRTRQNKNYFTPSSVKRLLLTIRGLAPGLKRVLPPPAYDAVDATMFAMERIVADSSALASHPSGFTTPPLYPVPRIQQEISNGAHED